jgi:hypothetical protein
VIDREQLARVLDPDAWNLPESIGTQLYRRHALERADRLLSDPRWAVLQLPEPIWQRGEDGEDHPDYPLAEVLFQSGQNIVEVDAAGCIAVDGPRVTEWASGAAHGFREGGTAYGLMSAILAASRAAQQTETPDV